MIMGVDDYVDRDQHERLEKALEAKDAEIKRLREERDIAVSTTQLLFVNDYIRLALEGCGVPGAGR
jgi:hypothetical protein